MARVPNILCAGGCGALLHGGRGSLASGLRTCRSCRLVGLAPIPARTRQPGPFRSCALSDCERKHFALGSCRQHYYQQRAAEGKDGRRTHKEVLIGGMVTTPRGRVLPWPISCEVVLPAGLWVFCPTHPGQRVFMGGDDLTHRSCACGTSVELNAEEASWVLYETLSMAS